MKITHITRNLHFRGRRKRNKENFDFDFLILAFDSIIANKVHTDKDQLFFLEKYTDRSANEEIKGSLATNSDIAYNQQTIGAAL